ncbi:MAG TPA: WD40 repeat domain-containing protein, partial [Gemmataceae bacterium]|nr:WD40 repeat domain-containing protein [Gemmataceae bacterium]
PDGKSLASRGEDRTIRLWETATGKQLRRLQVWRQEAASVTFSPDGRVLASPDGRRTIRRWQVATGEPLPLLIGSGLVVPSVAFSPDGKLLAACTRDEVPLHLWDTGAGKVVRRLGGVFWRTPFAFSPDGKLLAGGGEGVIYLWDPATGKLLRPLVDERYYVRLAALSTTGMALATAGSDGIIRLWGTATGREMRRLPGHPDAIAVLAFSPDDKTLVSDGGYDRTIVLWDAATGREVRRLPGHRGPVYGLAFALDGKTLVYSDTGARGLFGAREYLRVWDLATGKERQRFPVPHGAAFDVSADGSVAASAGKDGTIRVWDVASGKERQRWKGPAATARIELSPGEKFLITESDYSPQGSGITAAVWEVATGKPGPRLRGDWCLAITRDGRLAATQDTQLVIWLQEIATGKDICHLASEGRTLVAFSPDGRTLATSGPPGGTVLWEVATGQERHRLKGQQGVIQSLAFSADGTLLVSTSLYGSAIAWDWTGRHARERAASYDRPVRAQEALWADLASTDSGRAFVAMRALLATPRQAAALLRAHARPEPRWDAKRSARLIADLDDNKFAVRQRAARELEHLGEAAEAPLREVLKGQPSPEVRRHVQELLHNLETRSHSTEYLRGLRTLEILEYLGTPQARQVLQRLAGGASRARLTQEAKASRERLAKQATSLAR